MISGRLRHIGLVVLGIASAAPSFATGQRGAYRKNFPVFHQAGAPTLLLGTEEVLYDWDTMRCGEGNIPDNTTKAFRDASGTIHLILGNGSFKDLSTGQYVAGSGTYQFTGPDFNHLVYSCTKVFSDHRQGDPSLYDDTEWLWSFWSDPATNTVYSLMHHEYHGSAHPGESGCTLGSYSGCTWNSILFAKSTDGGTSYSHAPAPGHLVVSLPYTYEANLGRLVGYQFPSNIIDGNDGYYYALVGITGGSLYNEQKPGVSIMRTDNLDDPTSWRFWDGNDYTIAFKNPYLQASPPPDTIMRPRIGTSAGGSVVYSDDLGRYVRTFTYNVEYVDPDTRENVASSAFALMTSSDLIHWSTPSVFRLLDRSHCAEQYASLIDHASPTVNFTTMGTTPHLYHMRWHVCSLATAFNRDLIRLPVEIRSASEMSLLLKSNGWDYFGVSVGNRPAVGNNFLQVIGDQVSGIDFAAKLDAGKVRFDVKGNRFGVRGRELSVYLDPTTEFARAFYFPSILGYLKFIASGEILDAQPITDRAFFNQPHALGGGYAFIDVNTPPTAEPPLLTSATGQAGDPIACQPQNLFDFEGATVAAITSFQVQRAASSTFEHLALFIQPCDSLANFPNEPAPDYAGFDNPIDEQFDVGVPLVVPGAIGGAFEFHGGDAIAVSLADGMEPRTGQSFSAELWVRTQNTVDTMPIFSHVEPGPGPLSAFSYELFLEDGEARFYINYEGDSDSEVSLKSGLIADGQFHHLAFVADAAAGQLRAYRDGVVVNTRTWSGGGEVVGIHPITNKLILGGAIFWPGGFNGAIDDVRLYRLALPDAMIASHALKDYLSVPGSLVVTGDTWQCDLTPSDGREVGKTVTSNQLVIN